MLSLTKGQKKIGRIEGGEFDGKNLYLYIPDQKCCRNCSDKCKNARVKCCNNCGFQKGGCKECQGGFDDALIKDFDPFAILNDQYFINKKKRMSVIERDKIKRSLMKKIEPYEHDLKKIYNDAMADINEKIKSEIRVGAGKIIPLPCENENEPDHIYCAGQTGCGKSTWIGDYVNELKKLYPNKDVFIFSTFEEDPALDFLKPHRIEINQEIIDKPIMKEELKDSICIFDDIDTIQPKKLSRACQALRDDLLQNGRKMGIRTLATSHQLMNYSLTRDLLNSCQKIIYFPQATSPHHINRFLQEYIGLDKKCAGYIKNIHSRWVEISTHYPSYCLWDNGCVLINKLPELIEIHDKERKHTFNKKRYQLPEPEKATIQEGIKRKKYISEIDEDSDFDSDYLSEEDERHKKILVKGKKKK
jgi:hypothetical protein